MKIKALEQYQLGKKAHHRDTERIHIAINEKELELLIYCLKRKNFNPKRAKYNRKKFMMKELTLAHQILTDNRHWRENRK